MLQQAPQTITTTQLQRDPKIIDRINKNKQEALILRDSQQLGVYIPIQTYRKQIEEYKKLVEKIKDRAGEDNEQELERDLRKIKELAGGLRLQKDYTPEELNELFAKSYDTEIQMLS
ncbi:hypothetical protein GF389_00485 [Candidatus Dojkabacteria bacterium]|nr:hypothetical protein [Candidatus Dojkabacteria bacterium]